jgi:hypothetical protein
MVHLYQASLQRCRNRYKITSAFKALGSDTTFPARWAGKFQTPALYSKTYRSSAAGPGHYVGPPARPAHAL